MDELVLSQCALNEGAGQLYDAGHGETEEDAYDVQGQFVRGRIQVDIVHWTIKWTCSGLRFGDVQNSWQSQSGS